MKETLQGEEIGGFPRRKYSGALEGFDEMSSSADGVELVATQLTNGAKAEAPQQRSPIIEGQLYKRKSPAKSGKRVWVVLQTECLYIYKQQGVCCLTSTALQSLMYCSLFRM